MATGIEVAGLTLAVLPFFVNQIDGYVKGCEKAKLFRDKKYFQQHKRWKQSLRTELIFLNHALKTILYDCSKHIDVTPFFESPNPVSPKWDIKLLDGALQASLGDYYLDFQENLKEVNSALETICQKLGIDPTNDQSPDWDQVGVMKVFYAKLGAVFKQSLYKDMFDSLHLANENLRGLVDVVTETRERKISHTQSLKFNTLRMARERAKSLYRSIIGIQNWSCTNQNSSHVVQYMLVSPDSLELGEDSPTCELHFLGQCATSGLKNNAWVKSHFISREAGGSAPNLSPGSTKAGAANAQPGSKTSKRSRFVHWSDNLAFLKRSKPAKSSQSTHAPTNTVGAAVKHHSPQTPVVPQTNGDLCNWISEAHLPTASQIPVELTDQNSLWLHESNLEEHHDVVPRWESLDQILNHQVEGVRAKTPVDGIVFTFSQRLYVAACLTLAMFVLQNSWLPQMWQSRHIHFEIKQTNTQHGRVGEQSASIINTVDEKHPPPGDLGLVTCSTLLSIGCALVELGLCQTLEERRRDEEKRPLQAEMDLLTARNALPEVQDRAGKIYCNIARTCLEWVERNGQDFQDEDFQRDVFDKVVMPMLELYQKLVTD